MLILIGAALQVQIMRASPLPPVPPPPPPFTPKVEAVALQIGARVNAEFKRCGDASTNSNGRFVDAFGTPRFSAQWKNATVAMDNALTVCKGVRRALRKQEDFLVDIIQRGTRYDAGIAAPQLEVVSSELEAIEQYFSTEAPRYRQLLTVGWGNPHCAQRPDGFMPPSSICPKGAAASQK